MKFNLRCHPTKGVFSVRYTLDGKRLEFNIGTKVESTAQNIVRRMSLDWDEGKFDHTHNSYKLKNKEQSTPSPKPDAQAKKRITLLELWDKWVSTLELDESYTQNHHYWVRRWIEKYGSNVKPDDASWYQNLKPKVVAKTWNNRKSYLNSCLKWAINEGIWQGKNPYASLKPSSKKGKDNVKPFEKSEIKQILEAFKNNTFCPKSSAFPHSHYYPLVCFLFATGVRTGEAIGIRWKHIDFEESKIWIVESMSKRDNRRVRKTTKTDTSAWIPLTDSLKEVLLSIRPENPEPDDLVFKSIRGGLINPDDFRKRIWKVVLEGLKIEYRYPYQCRHTLLSHTAKEQGLLTAARLGRHSNLQMVQKHYGKFVGDLEIPDLIE